MVKEKTVVLYPGFFAAHFVPMMQLADALLEQGYAVEVALIDVTMDHDAELAAAVARAAATKPEVAFHRLPRIPDLPAITKDAPVLVRYFTTIRRYNAGFRELLRSLRASGRVLRAVILDGPSAEAIDVTRELGVPAYTFFATKNASVVAVFVQLPWILREGQQSFRELGDAPLDLRGVAPLPASHLMGVYLEDPDSEVYRANMVVTRRISDADGFLVNTLASLEPRAVAALRDPGLVADTDGRTPPPVYCVGPLVVAPSEATKKHECLAWLDQQPERSVVFLCFGSLGAVSSDQLREIAAGLERSGHRFLWVVRAPNGTDPEGTSGLDLDALLPEGFVERIGGRGLVVKLWAPQLEVLHHRATGVFVTHGGWNSAMEAITAGVPMICWPLHSESEQKMNKVFMVEEARIGVEVAGWQQGLVMAEEVEAKVRLVMESEEGEQLLARVTEHRDAAAMAWKDGGSSRAAFDQFLSDAGAPSPEQTLA